LAERWYSADDELVTNSFLAETNSDPKKLVGTAQTRTR
jgi:hypothetical protein